MAVDGDRLRDCLQDLARDRGDVTDVRRFHDQQRELVVTHASDGVFLAGGRAQALGDFFQKLISALSAERLVDDIEAIEV